MAILDLIGLILILISYYNNITIISFVLIPLFIRMVSNFYPFLPNFSLIFILFSFLDIGITILLILVYNNAIIFFIALYFLFKGIYSFISIFLFR
jgi:hypothetical protein